MLIIKACTKAGYRLLAATNGEEALSLATSHKDPIDLLLTDVIMPGMNGRALADKVTQLRPETKVLYCSGYAENAIIHHGVLNLQATFLPKPFTATALLQAIREILNETY
jgi:two-component system cell cycle sensor histidine kinase/response regulator CckA